MPNMAYIKITSKQLLKKINIVNAERYNMKSGFYIFLTTMGFIGLIALVLYNSLDYLILNPHMTRAEYIILTFKSGRILLYGLFATIAALGWLGVSRK